MHINLATEAAGQAGQNEMLKKYLDGKIVDWETIEICPHPPPTDPPQARQNAVAKRSGRN